MEMATHYAFVIYCMEVIALLGWIIILCKANGGIIFEVQTFRNSQKEIEVSPRGVRIFSKWVGGISGIIMIGILGKVIMYAGHSMDTEYIERKVSCNAKRICYAYGSDIFEL